MIKVLIADDHAMIRESLSVLLQQYDDIELIGTANNGLEVLEQLKITLPDVILLDLHMPEMDGLTCAKHIVDHKIPVKILILTAYENNYDVLRAIHLGVSGFLLKGITSEELHQAIQNVYHQHAVINSDLVIKSVNTLLELVAFDFDQTIGDPESLTKQEMTIVRHIILGYTNKEIAEKLYLSEGSIRNQISHIYTKLHLRNRTQLAIWGLRLNMGSKNEK